MGGKTLLSLIPFTLDTYRVAWPLKCQLANLLFILLGVQCYWPFYASP